MEGARKLLRDLNPSKASVPDEVPCRLLKELADELAPILRVLFEQSLHTGTFPKDWKRAKVTPVFRKGNVYLPENYRPISLTCVCIKLLEHIVACHIRQHLQTYILSPVQHGFQAYRSCESQLLITLQIYKTLCRTGKQVNVAVLDFAKAFDTVPHSKKYSPRTTPSP